MCLCFHSLYLSIVSPAEYLFYTAEARDKYNEWTPEHVCAFLRCLFGGAQHKVGTKLWATADSPMLRAAVSVFVLLLLYFLSLLLFICIRISVM